MRKLTRHEAENKPVWAKSYDIQVQTGYPIFYATARGGEMPIPNEEFDGNEIEYLKKEISQLKAENASVAAYAEQRINMLKKTNGNLVSEIAELKVMNGRLNEFLVKSFNEYNSTGKLSAKISLQGGAILAESEVLIYGSDREGES